MRKIKWENIVFIIVGGLFISCMYSHIQLNGFYKELFVEFGMYSTMALFIRYVVKDIRKNPSNWS